MKKDETKNPVLSLLDKYAEFETVEEGLTKLKEAVKLRDQMGGVIYWNIMNEDCREIADKARGMGATREDLSAILGKGTHH